MMVPISGCWHGGSLAGGFSQCHGGKPSSCSAGQPLDVGLCLKSMETFDDPCSQGPCGHSIYRTSLWDSSCALDPNAGLLWRCPASPGGLQEGLAQPAANGG